MLSTYLKQSTLLLFFTFTYYILVITTNSHMTCFLGWPCVSILVLGHVDEQSLQAVVYQSVHWICEHFLFCLLLSR